MRLSALADAAAYQNGVRRISQTTYQQKYIGTQRCLIRTLGDARLGALSPADVDRWQKEQEGRDITVRTANMYKSTARAMFRRIGRDDLAQVLVLKDPGPPKSKAMSDEHFELLLRYANLRDAAILLLLRHSGRRRATICRLRMADTKIWQAPGGDFRLASKSVEKGDRRVLVFAKHRAALATMLWMDSRPDPDSEFVFTHLDSGQPLLPNAVTQTFARLKRAARIPKDVQVSPHTLRHRFAQDKLSDGFDQRIVADWMGITVDTVLQVYATRSEEQLERIFFEGR